MHFTVFANVLKPVNDVAGRAETGAPADCPFYADERISASSLRQVRALRYTVTVTSAGSPPNCLMLFCTHDKARSWSMDPRLLLWTGRSWEDGQL